MTLHFVLLQVSVTNALDMMLTGRNIVADKAKRMGLVDGVVLSLGRMVALR